MSKFIFLIVCFFIPFHVTAHESMAESQEWLSLVHYHPNFLGRYKGSIDSESFYLAKDGRINPKAELEATIKLFVDGSDKQKMCLFPARYIFLLNNGLIEKTNVKCEEFEKFKEDLQPSGITMIFTDAYMNNPSSLFGHTLLRIDTSRQGTQMIAHGANYGAYYNDENGFLYAVYGLTGGYFGGWTIKPYYNIINTYNNIENRDIWELNLNFTKEEQDLFIAHLWELGHTQTRYYFFTKNCSYMLVEAFDAIRPSLKLADQFWLQTIPLDTLKAVYRKKNLVKNVNYRPSRQTKIIYQKQQMNAKQQKALLSIIKDENYTQLTELSNEEKTIVLETAYQYIQYRFIKKEFSLSEYRKKSFSLLSARNKLPSNKENNMEKIRGHSPLLSHESMRATIGVGSRNGENFQEFSYRPAYHSLTDNNYGLLPGAEINFLNFKIRHYDQSQKTVLSEFDLLDIRSLSPIDNLFYPISFAVSLNVSRETHPQTQKEGYVGNGKVSGGGTIEVIPHVYSYIMGSGYGSYGGFLPHNQYVGIGLSGGIFIDYKYFKLLAEVEKQIGSNWYADKTKYHIEANIPILRNLGMAVEYRYDNNQQGKNVEEYLTSLRYYF